MKERLEPPVRQQSQSPPACDDPETADHRHAFATEIIHAGREPLRRHGFVNPPVHRGSTVLFPSCGDWRELGRLHFEQSLTYGAEGGPTHYALEDAVAGIEGGTRSLIVGSGLAAIMVALLAYLKAGDRCLIPDSVYGPTRRLAEGQLRDWGIETCFYDPLVDEAGMAALLDRETRVVFLESPGSHTFEVQDVPGIARAAHAHGAKVLMDNTWGIHHFQPFRHGVDISVQALTKYVGGHSDILLGAVIVNDEADWHAVRSTGNALGQYASPDDCWLALRGVRTLAMRLKHQTESAMAVAAWLEKQPQVLRVLYPALPSHPQHDLFKRDFTGACSLFGVVLRPGPDESQVFAMLDGLQLFGIGASWGGYESLALPTTGSIRRNFVRPGEEDVFAFRLHIGLEDPADLIADLADGLRTLPQANLV